MTDKNDALWKLAVALLKLQNTAYLAGMEAARAKDPESPSLNVVKQSAD